MIHTGKESIEQDGDQAKAPENVIHTASSAKVIYDRLKDSHYKRCQVYSQIQGMLDGNPPYNPKAMKSSGLAHMCNVNWKDGEAIYKSAALAYWSLFNDVESIAEFQISLAQDGGQNALWGRIISEEWDRTIRSWPNFAKHMSFHQGELLKFGLNAIIWPDERDWRFKPIAISCFLVPDQTQNDTESIATVAIEHKYSAHYLWQVYENAESSGHWDKDALADVLYRTSLVADEKIDSQSGCVDIQKRIRNGDLHYDSLYNDDITLVSILSKEYDDKITHSMIHHELLTEEFVYQFDRQYDSIEAALIYFSLSPGQETIHANKGVGHSILSSIQAITQLDCSVFDQTKRASSLLLRSGTRRGSEQRQIRFTHGGVIDIGEAEIAQNTFGNNVGNTVEVSRYFRNKIFTNNNISGHDPAFADRNIQSAQQARLQATKEARIQKNTIAHYYETLDHFFRELVRKMLNSRRGYPGYEYCEGWKSRCIDRGVPPEIFEIRKAKKTPNGLPVYLEVTATRSAGSGSQMADQMEMERIMSLLPTLGERGRKAAIQDYIAAHRGHRYVTRYFPPEDQDSEPTGDDTLASIENNQFSDGKQVIVSPDNNHLVHATNHMRLMQEILQAYRQDPQAQVEEGVNLLQKADEILQVAGPHFVKHLFFLAQDPTRRSETEKLNAEWAVVANFGDQISVNAGRQREAELRDVQKQQQALQEQQEQNTPAHIKARGDIQLKAQKLEAQIQRDRMRDQFKFILAREHQQRMDRVEETKMLNRLAREGQELLLDRPNATDQIP